MSFRDILLPLPCENPQNHELKKFLFFTIKQQKGYLEGCKVAQEVKALLLRLRTGSHTVEGKNQFFSVGL